MLGGFATQMAGGDGLAIGYALQSPPWFCFR
jgi:hypothetical protein